MSLRRRNRTPDWNVDGEGSPAERVSASVDPRLHAALEENKRLQLALQTVRHNMGNHLALLSAMLVRQARASDEPAIREGLQAAQRRVHAVAESMRLDVVGAVNDCVSSTTLVERTIATFSGLATGAEVKIEAEVQEFPLRRDDALSFMLILNELVANSLKHAFPGDMGGVVRIRLTHQPNAVGGSIVLVVEDNGVGRAERARAGLGTTVIASATQRLDAKMFEEQVVTDDQRPGLRTTISRRHP